MTESTNIAWRSKAEVRKIRDCRLWRDKVRPAKLLQDPCCEKCLKKERLVEATEVDHIKPLEQGGAPFDFDNLQSLCKPCHVKKSAEEARQRGRSGVLVCHS